MRILREITKIWISYQVGLSLTQYCGKPGYPEYGEVALPSGGPLNITETYFVTGTRASYKCDEGSIRFGPESRECQANGAWSERIPSCSNIVT